MSADELQSNLRDAPLMQLVAVAGGVFARRWHQFASGHPGLTPAGSSALLTIATAKNGDGDPNRITHTDLARRMWIRPATLTGIVEPLVRAGYLRRDRDPHDRRVVWLTLTETGVERAQQVKEQAGAWFGSLLTVDDPEHEKIIRDFLIKVITTYIDKEHMDVWDRRPGRRRSRKADQEVPEA